MEKALSPRLVAALDSARSAAATYVVIHHLARHYGCTSGICTIFSFGQEAVVVFFLLSGFVIFANERKRVDDLISYYLRRLRRIYPTLLIAMGISILVATFNGSSLSPFPWKQTFGTLFALQDISSLKPGVIVEPFLDNSPLWSLSYEVAFYILFPSAMVIWKRYPTLTSTVIGLGSCASLAAYAMAPNHFTLVGAYFLVWWCGAMVARAYQAGGKAFWEMDASIIWLAALVGISIVIVIAEGYAGLGIYPFLLTRHFGFALFAILLLFGPFGRITAQFALKFGAPSAWLASISYGLYVFHYPILVQWKFAQSHFGLALAFVLLLLVSYLGDRELNRILPRPRRKPRIKAT